MINKQKSLIIIISFITIGIIAGFLYWRFIGCVNATCPLKSNVYLMILQGSLFGFLLGNFVLGFLKRKDN
jgi:hypothetical protein